MNDQLFTVRHLAKRWHFAKGTLDQWRIQGQGPVFMKIRGKILYRLSDVEAYEAAAVLQKTSAQERDERWKKTKKHL